jgi:L-threonylcarbamoyladenylate synthase
LPVHYAPDARVVLVHPREVMVEAAAALADGQQVGLLALDPPAQLPEALVVLEAPADVDHYARVLYARLREADRRGLDVLFVIPPPEGGLGSAVRDRLRRAAARSAP